MHITVAFNKFGPGLVQRMPRFASSLASHVYNQQSF
jgi:hypothetical protein